MRGPCRLAMLMMVAAHAASAQPPPAAREAVRAACAEDVRRLCPDAAGNPLRVRSCLVAQPARLRPNCRASLEAAGLIPGASSARGTNTASPGALPSGASHSALRPVARSSWTTPVKAEPAPRRAGFPRT